MAAAVDTSTDRHFDEPAWRARPSVRQAGTRPYSRFSPASELPATEAGPAG